MMIQTSEDCMPASDHIRHVVGCNVLVATYLQRLACCALVAITTEILKKKFACQLEQANFKELYQSH